MAITEQIADLVAKMRAERAALLAALDGMSEQRAGQRPAGPLATGEGEGGWSVKEQLAHLAQMESSYREWCQRAVREDNPDVGVGSRPDPVAFTVEQAHTATLRQHIAELDGQRERTHRFMETLSTTDYDRPAHNQLFGELTTLQWLRSYYRHDRMHTAQIEGRESEYRPRVLNGEPDQRHRDERAHDRPTRG